MDFRPSGVVLDVGAGDVDLVLAGFGCEYVRLRSGDTDGNFLECLVCSQGSIGGPPGPRIGTGEAVFAERNQPDRPKDAVFPLGCCRKWRDGDPTETASIFR